MKIPPYQDIATLTANLCISETHGDVWVKQGLFPRLPPPVTRGTKRLWKWSQVEQYLDGPSVAGPEAELEEIRNETRRQASNAR
jgi:hypothetical protein